MFNEGDKVVYFRYNDDGSIVEIDATVVSTFYEPGDPVQGVNLRADNGDVYGGVDSQDCRIR